MGQTIALRHQVFAGFDAHQAQCGEQRGRKRRLQIVNLNERFF
ncbi:hypothetical protein [Serratia ureilytica]|nr:hypothetical protein [Serratia ureilytica]